MNASSDQLDYSPFSSPLPKSWMSIFSLLENRHVTTVVWMLLHSENGQMTADQIHDHLVRCNYAGKVEELIRRMNGGGLIKTSAGDNWILSDAARQLMEAISKLADHSVSSSLSTS